MPKVPSYDNFQTTPTTRPDVSAGNGLSTELATIGARQQMEFGKAMQGAGDAVGAIALDAQNTANALRVDDARNQAKELEFKLKYDKQVGYTNIHGVDALQRESGKPLADEYADKYKEGIGAITETLGNDAQKRAFTEHANQSLVNFHGEAMAHEGEQFKTYALSVHEGTIRNAMNDIGINYNNPGVINKNIESIKAATYEAAKMQDKSATFAEAQGREMTSKAHLTALEAALQKNDPQYADAYLKKYSKDMNADDILRANGVLTKELDSKIALDTANLVMQQAVPKIVPSDSDRAFNVAIGTESGGRQFAGPGVPLTSPKGAIGIAQVMPTTAPEAAKMAGLQWDEAKYKNDASYNRALGKAYFDHQLKDFGGNLPQAYAAYNAGPGRTREALAAAAKDGSDWLSHMPAETQDYVQKNMTAYATGGGQEKKPTLIDLQAQVRERIGTQNPQRLKLALDETERQFNDVQKAVKQRNDEAVTNAMRAVEVNGGRFTDLPADVRGAIPPDEVGKVMDFAQKVSKGDDSTSLLLYNKLTNDPGYLKNLTDADFYKLKAELSETDFKHFSNERAKLVSGNVTNGPGDLNTGAIKLVLDDRLRMMGIDPTPKDETSEALRVGAIRKFVNDNIAVTQANTGKKMSDAEVSQHIDYLFAKNAIYEGFFTDSSGPMLGMKPGNIPGKIKDALKDAFKRNGVDSPSDADLLNAYWRQLTVKPKASGASGRF